MVSSYASFAEKALNGQIKKYMYTTHLKIFGHIEFGKLKSLSLSSFLPRHWLLVSMWIMLVSPRSC